MSDTATCRIVLDTNQIISAGSKWLDGGNPSPATPVQQLVYMVMTTHTGLYSSSIAAEYLKKLLDRKHPLDRLLEYLGCLLKLFEEVKVGRKTCDPIPEDPDDVVFLLCALDGQAHYLITEDKHLLKVREGYSDFRIGKRDEIMPLLMPSVKVEVPQAAQHV